MRINAINRSYLGLKNNTKPSFRADVMIIPSCAEPGQPHEDKAKLEKAAENFKKELQRKYPSQNDNIVILLQPDGFRSSSNKRDYFNTLKFFIGYKDPEIARKKILEEQKTLDDEDRLELSTIKKLETREPKMMRMLNNLFIDETNPILSSNLSDTINQQYLDGIDYTIEMLDYLITEHKEPTAEELKKQDEIRKENELSKFRYWIKHWLDDASPPIY